MTGEGDLGRGRPKLTFSFPSLPGSHGFVSGLCLACSGAARLVLRVQVKVASCRCLAFNGSVGTPSLGLAFPLSPPSTNAARGEVKASSPLCCISVGSIRCRTGRSWGQSGRSRPPHSLRPAALHLQNTCALNRPMRMAGGPPRHLDMVERLMPSRDACARLGGTHGSCSHARPGALDWCHMFAFLEARNALPPSQQPSGKPQ